MLAARLSERSEETGAHKVLLDDSTDAAKCDQGGTAEMEKINHTKGVQ